MKMHRSTRRVEPEVITVRPRVELMDELMVRILFGRGKFRYIYDCE